MFHLDRIKSIAQEGEHAVSADVQKFVAYLEQKWAAMTHSIETLEEHAADAVRYFEGAKAAPIRQRRHRLPLQANQRQQLRPRLQLHRKPQRALNGR
jgi:hypothetical protein